MIWLAQLVPNLFTPCSGEPPKTVINTFRD
jgi:hypothetical protein